MKTRSRPRRALVSIALLLGATACRQRDPNWLTAPTPGTHSAFSIASGPHAADCGVCHGPFPTFAQFTCFGCHAHDAPATDPQHATVAGYTYASTACYGCHADPTTLPVPDGVVADPAASVAVDTLVPSFAETTIVALSPQRQTLAMGMDHASPPLGALPACGTCHASAGSGSYYPGVLHSSLATAQLPQPSTCGSCHAGSMPVGFVGPLANPARTPPSGEMNHVAVSWAGGAPTGNRIVAWDCGVCHVSPSTAAATWATNQAGGTPARFHASLAAAGQPQPSSCLDCHANSRPARVLAAPAAALPAGVSFDHATSPALDDCASCHAGAASAAPSWAGGRLHVAGSATPGTCLPCHAGERPTSAAGWVSTTFSASPFDYGTSAAGITHGDGQDCAVCHAGPGTGTWGGGQTWVGGRFSHGASTVAATTCLACHSSQRPDLQPGTTAAAMASLLGFDHARDGTGDCFGCHQATVGAGSYAAYVNPATRALPGGDWKGGVAYPGSTLVGSPTQLHSVTELVLNRGGAGNLVQSVSTVTATLYDSMLHVSPAVPAAVSPGPSASPDMTRCWHCHTSASGTVTSYAEGRFHPSLQSYTATPGGTITPLSQPTTGCRDCHANTVPSGIVEAAGSDLQPMDHQATFTGTFTVGGKAVTGVAAIECAACHHSPTSTWADGTFHASIGAAVPQDCTVCHYPLMADAARADVTSGTLYRMAHRSPQVTFQGCGACHAAALSRSTVTPLAATAWQPGSFHPSLATQPGGCLDCHGVSVPPAGTPTQSTAVYVFASGGTATNTGQWMSHASRSVAGLDCVACHAADARPSGAAWSRSTSFHARVASPPTCQECHGLTNGGGAVVGTNNNMPLGLTSSSTATTASQDPSTGVPAGTLDTITHADVNVTGHDCSFCHTQVGPSTTQGIAGREWAQARFHASFGAATPLVLNGTTGRCSNCHMNVKPASTFTAQDHAAFTSTPGTQDCSACHSWPGTGTAAAPNWLGASGAPQFIAVGGFTIPQPPATSAILQTGIASLPHPATVTGTGTTIACSTCHTGGVGAKNAIGYDHASTLITTNCNACHEAGSNLVGTPWNASTSQGSGAGDTRPFTLASIVARRGTDSCNVSSPKHFYPVDCGQCHPKPAGTGAVTTGTAYTTAWTFSHQTSSMSNPGTCNLCHTGTSCPK